MGTVLTASMDGVAGEVGYALRLPPKLKAALEKWARQERRSLNAQIVIVLEQAVTTHDPDALKEAPRG